LSASGRHPDDRGGAGEHGGGPTVLIVDDEDALVRGLRLTFEREGFRVLAAGDGPAAVRLARTERPDLIILDLMLPGIGGLEVCRRLRGDADPRARSVPIIILTARDDDVDKIVGLEVGADDYVTKPFNSRELVARTRAALRRRDLDRLSAAGGTTPDPGSGPASSGSLSPLAFAGLVIDPARRRAVRDGRNAGLTATEFDLLLHLAASPGRVFTREQLLQAVWGYDFAGADRTVDVHVRRLREKIEPDPAHPTYVLTSWGRGYFFGDGPAVRAPGDAPAVRAPGDAERPGAKEPPP